MWVWERECILAKDAKTHDQRKLSPAAWSSGGLGQTPLVRGLMRSVFSPFPSVAKPASPLPLHSWPTLNGTRWNWRTYPNKSWGGGQGSKKSKGDLGPWGERSTCVNSGWEHKAWMWSQEQGSASGPGGDARPVKGGTDRPKMEKETSSVRRLGAGLDHSRPGVLLRSKTSVMTTTLTSEKPSLWPRWVKAKTKPSIITFALNTGCCPSCRSGMHSTLWLIRVTAPSPSCDTKFLDKI